MYIRLKNYIVVNILNINPIIEYEKTSFNCSRINDL
jgi:hypothetical protein